MEAGAQHGVALPHPLEATPSLTATALPESRLPAPTTVPGLRIGALELSTPIFIAPMGGITDRPFRAFAREMGVGLTCTEMTACWFFLNMSRPLSAKSSARQAAAQGRTRA